MLPVLDWCTGSVVLEHCMLCIEYPKAEKVLTARLHLDRGLECLLLSGNRRWRLVSVSAETGQICRFLQGIG